MFGIVWSVVNCLIGLCVGLFLLIVILLCVNIYVIGNCINVVRWIVGCK